MTVQITELFDSRIVTIAPEGFTEKRVYHIDGQQDPSEYAELLQADLGEAHPVYKETILKQIDLRPEPRTELLLAEYTYGPRGDDNNNKQRNGNGEIWQWEMTAQSAHINSVEQRKIDLTNKYTFQQLYNNAALTGGDADTIAIGIDGDNATGTEVYRPYGALKVTKSFPIAEIDMDYRKTLYAMQNTTNNAAWLEGEFGQEEILFLGANIRYDFGTQLATLDYNFLFGPTRDEMKFQVIKEEPVLFDEVVDVTLTNVRPFEYIWIKYPAKAQKIPVSLGDPSLGSVERRHAEGVYRDKLYLTSDFTQLGLVGPE